MPKIIKHKIRKPGARPRHKDPARRTPAPRAAPDPSRPAPLTVDPAEVRRVSDGLATLRSRQGGPDLTGRQPSELTLAYDARAGVKAERMGYVLDGEAKVVGLLVQRSGVTPGSIGGRGRKYEAAYEFRFATELLDGALADSVALVQRKGLRMARRLLAKTEALLAALPLDDPRRKQLEVQAARMRDKADKLRKAMLERAKKTRSLKQQHAATLTAAQKRQKLAQTMVAMKEGLPVDPQAEAEALDAFAAAEARSGDVPVDAAPARKATQKTTRKTVQKTTRTPAGNRRSKPR